MQYHKVPQAFWLYTSACLFYTHPPTPGFLARHHAPQITTVLAGLWLYTFGCIQMRAYFKPTRQPQAFWPDTTHHKPQEYWQACGCIHLAVYKCVLILHPPANPRLFGQTPRTTNHNSIGRLVAVYKCVLILHPPANPRLFGQTPRTTNHNSIGRLVAVYKCVLILNPPANPRLFGQTPRTTNHNSIGRLVAVYIWLFTNACLFTPTRQPQAFWPDTTHHKPQQYWQAGGCIQMRAYFTPACQPQAFWPDTTHHGLLKCG